MITPRCIRLKIPKEDMGMTWRLLQKAGIPRPAQEKKDFDFVVISESEGDEGDVSPDEDEVIVSPVIPRQVAGKAVRHRDMQQPASVHDAECDDLTPALQATRTTALPVPRLEPSLSLRSSSPLLLSDI